MGAEVEVDTDIRGGFQLRRQWRWIAEAAERQHGVVSRAQLLAAGAAPRQIDRLVAARHLHPIHRGVYAVGHRRLTSEGRWTAAVLTGGASAVVSHQTAAMNWHLISRRPSPPAITTPIKGRRRRGIAHHTAQLPADEITSHGEIPTTTVARTLLDLAATLDPHRLERALAEAEYRRYADSPPLGELLARHPGHRGVVALRAILASGSASLGVTRSPLEERFLRFLDDRGLERPQLNAAINLGASVIYSDCLWRSAGIAAELDGRAAHRRNRTFESDRLRDRRLTTIGLRPIRITSRQLEADPGAVEADLRAIGVRDRLSA